MEKYSEFELRRQVIQSELDGSKSHDERKAMGQFPTPFALAKDILEHAKKIMRKHEKIRFLDPAFGTGSFFSALNAVFSSTQIEVAAGYEIDEYYGKPSSELWAGTILDYRLLDFTNAKPPTTDEDKFNLIICNPPYVRHHNINGQKKQLQAEALIAANIELSGLAGLYCYFIALSHRWMQPNGIAGWLIPSEFMDVNYGEAVKNYLINEVTLLQIHRFDPNEVQFTDVLVSSVVVWFKNKRATKNHRVKFSYGGTIDNPHLVKYVGIKTLSTEKKWTRFPLSDKRVDTGSNKLGDFFDIRRGIATGDNNFFVMSRNEIKKRGLPLEQFRPILPSPRHLSETVINTDKDGNPEIENQLFVLNCELPLEVIKQIYPMLHAYLQEGIKAGVSERYLCRKRKIWYSQESRSESLFYFTYFGRSDKEGKKPFRFILNNSKAVVSNSYLILYPKTDLKKELENDPDLKRILLATLNRISSESMLNEGRFYGGGLHKMEPKELANVTATEVTRLLSKSYAVKGLL